MVHILLVQVREVASYQHDPQQDIQNTDYSL
jgi:hypothetical protein